MAKLCLFFSFLSLSLFLSHAISLFNKPPLPIRFSSPFSSFTSPIPSIFLIDTFTVSAHLKFAFYHSHCCQLFNVIFLLFSTFARNFHNFCSNIGLKSVFSREKIFGVMKFEGKKRKIFIFMVYVKFWILFKLVVLFFIIITYSLIFLPYFALTVDIKYRN